MARLAHWPPGEYLGLIRPNRRDAVIALVSLALFLPGFDVLTYLLGRDIVTPFQVTSYLSARTSGVLPLLWFTFVIDGTDHAHARGRQSLGDAGDGCESAMALLSIRPRR